MNKKNQYEAIAFNISTGSLYWSKALPNGGYGAPAVTDNALILPSKFTNIVALSKEHGSELWQIETSTRVRSPINVYNEKIYFSSGGTIYEVDCDGNILFQWHLQNAFFYGSVEKYHDLVISLGTITDANEDSIVTLFAFHKEGGLAYSLPISKTSIVSADTVGITIKEHCGFLGTENQIICFQLNTGKILWSTPVDGFAGRQVCSTDDQRVYYSTLSGVIGALSIEEGYPIWHINTNDTSIVSPISVLKEHILVLADAHLNVLCSQKGILINKIPVGHSPYSMVSLKEDWGLVGAGEPPHNGLLFAFNFSNLTKTSSEFECIVSTSNAFIESQFVDILVKISTLQNLVSIKLDCSIFNISDLLEGTRTNSKDFLFRVPLPKTISVGDYVIPLYISTDTNEITQSICISFKRKKPLPTKVLLNNIPEIVQETPMYSGAAIGAAIRNFYGDNVKQSDLREMIDFSRLKSGYEPFQTWRILLRRMLTSSATTKTRLPEFKE